MFFKKIVIFLVKNAKKCLFFHNYVSMNKNFFIQPDKKIHFIGVGGVSVSALAKYCIGLGASVSGSDKQLSAVTDELKTLGVKIYLGHHKNSVIGKDLVVYSSAINENCPELVSAEEHGIKTMQRGEFLGKILETYNNVVAVSGSHGKTTTTAMLSEIFIAGGFNPTVFLGGEYKGYKNFRKGENEYAVTEACEYKKNFLKITHTSSIVLNVDNDHLDSYADMDDMKDCFRRFIGDGLSLVNADDQNCKQVFNNTTATFGIKKTATFNAKNLHSHANGYSFDFYAYQKKIGNIRLNVLGRHNVYNALASSGMAYLYNVKFSAIKKGLKNFCGVKRRNEYIGDFYGASVYTDYAHHPAEISATLSTFNAYEKNTLVIFQPHTYSRTRILMKDFTKVLSGVENLIIYKTYSAREEYDASGSGERLAENLKSVGRECLYSDDVKDLFQKTQAYIRKGVKKIVVLGAGDIYDIFKKTTSG